MARKPDPIHPGEILLLEFLDCPLLSRKTGTSVGPAQSKSGIDWTSVKVLRRITLECREMDWVVASWPTCRDCRIWVYSDPEGRWSGLDLDPGSQIWEISVYIVLFTEDTVDTVVSNMTA